ncbi:MAG: Transglycosylase-associated protein [Hyphomicrobiales bacterium]|nr:Transglycosylase-associated protein [Hyphomicrobiales bacterium]
MDQPLSVMGTPGVGFFSLLLIGALAGWIAERVTQSDHGLFTNILVGIAGSFVGSKLAEAFDVRLNGFFGHLIAAALGAVLVLWAWRALRGRRDVRGPLDGGPPVR